MKPILRYLLQLIRFLLFRSPYVRSPVILKHTLLLNFKKFKLQLLRVPTKIDVITLDHVFSLQQYNLSKWTQFHKLLNLKKNQQKLVLDLGANVGFSCLYFCNHISDVKILAVEPEMNNLKCLEYNSINYDEIKIINGAIGGSPGKANIFDTKADSNAFTVNRSKDELLNNLTIFSINQLIDMHQAKELFIVKIDIEGFEDDLFSDNLSWIDKTDIIIIELHDWLFPFKNKSKNFIHAISGLNRDLIVDGENLISFKNAPIRKI